MQLYGSPIARNLTIFQAWRRARFKVVRLVTLGSGTIRSLNRHGSPHDFRRTARHTDPVPRCM
jgi:hypothetical protein